MVSAHSLRLADVLRPLLIAAFLALGWLLLGAGNAHAVPAFPLSLQDAANPAMSTVSLQSPADALSTDALSTSALDTVAPTAPAVVEKVTAKPGVSVVHAAPLPLPAAVASVPVAPVTAPIAEDVPRLTSAAVQLAEPVEALAVDVVEPVEALAADVVEPVRQISQTVPSVVVSDLPLKSELLIVASATAHGAEHGAPAETADPPAAVKAEQSLASEASSTHALSQAVQPAFPNAMAWLAKMPLLTPGSPAPAIPTAPPCSPSSSPGLAPSGSGSQTGAFWLSDSTPGYIPALGTAIEISGQCPASLSFEPGSSPD